MLQPQASREGLDAIQLFQAQLDFVQARFYREGAPKPSITFSWTDTLTNQVRAFSDNCKHFYCAGLLTDEKNTPFLFSPPGPFLPWLLSPACLFSQPVDFSDIAHEQASVLFNLSAVASQIAQVKWRESGDGAFDEELREALNLLKTATAALKRIAQDFSGTPATDLSSSACTLFEAIFEAQVRAKRVR